MEWYLNKNKEVHWSKGACKEVVKGVVLGDAKALTDLALLTCFRVTHILCVGGELVQKWPTRYVYKRVEVNPLIG